MSSQLEVDRQQNRSTREAGLTTLQKGSTQLEAKLKRLTTAYLEEALSLSEYRELKNKLMEDTVALQEQIKRFEAEGENRLEPLTRFVKSLQEATLLASTENSVEKVKFLKKTGSNLTIKDRILNLDFHEPWKTVENHGRFAQCETRAPDSGARAIGETNTISTSAEEVRFELTGPLLAHRFSRPAHSAALPLLRNTSPA